MARQMAQAKFRKEQWDHRYDEHIAPMNNLVDELKESSARGWLPYIAPMYGGVQARLLSVLRDPGPATQDNTGSGFLCMENNDPTAETMFDLFSQSKIDAHDIVPWNAYPWYINRAPNAEELDAGVEPLRQIIALLPDLKVVMLHGGQAQNGWKRLVRRYPNLVDPRKIRVIATYHTSRQAFWHKDPTVREARRQHLRDAFKEAAQILGNPAPN